MRGIALVLAIVVATALMTTPPITADPLLKPRTAIWDVGDEALNIAEKATQTVDWLRGDDNSNDDKSESSARIG